MQEWKEDWASRAPHAKERHKKLIKRLAKLKSNKNVNVAAGQIHDQVFSKVDCLECANCCTSIPPMINETDVRRISKSLGINSGEFKVRYVVFDDDGDMVMNESPCPFLGEGNKCEIYDIRPKACRQYPHTDGHEFSKYLQLHLINVQYCPAVFHILEKLDATLKTS